MHLEAILFPPFVRFESFDLAEDASADRARLSEIELPPELARAAPKRKIEYAAGRLCARGALRRLAPDAARGDIPVGPDGDPVWPPGIVGSITHTKGFAAAAVARGADVAGLGLDSERIAGAEVEDGIAARIARRDELEALRHQCDLPETLLRLALFSAKESVFKGLYRTVRCRFDFLDVVVRDLDPAGRTFSAELLGDLGPLPQGMLLHGRLAIVGDLVHTSLLLPLGPPGPRGREP